MLAGMGAGDESLRRKLLLLDPHQQSLRVLYHVLTKRGHYCEMVQTEDDALAQCRTFGPNVFIYEWSGRVPLLGLPARVREAVGPSRRVVVIALSTQDEPDGFRVEQGVNAYVTKPFATDALIAMIEASAAE